MAAILKNGYDLMTMSRIKLDEIWQADAEWHADGDPNVKIGTGSKIRTWRTFVFRNRK